MGGSSGSVETSMIICRIEVVGLEKGASKNQQSTYSCVSLRDLLDLEAPSPSSEATSCG